MATQTTNYKLTKPGENDTVEINDLNNNFDKIDETLFNKVEKVVGKGLSANDYTDEDKQTVGTIVNKVEKIEGKGLSTNDYTNEDKKSVNTIANKVDKVEGKELSSNDYTDEDKKKLNSLEVHPKAHLASMIVFTDGETLQDKFNNNTLFTPSTGV